MSLVCLKDYEAATLKRVSKHAMDYYKSGAGDELTLRLNQTTWDKYDDTLNFAHNNFCTIRLSHQSSYSSPRTT